MPKLHSFVVVHVRETVLATMMILFSFDLLGCSSGAAAISRKTFDVFEGFTFVGSGPYQQSAPLADNEALPKHGTTEQPLPDLPKVGVQYVFHHRAPVDNEKLALADLPARLRTAGIEVTKAPKSSKEMLYLFRGGPLFKILIRDGGHEGTIYNQLDPDLVKASNADPRWTEEDYVLLWLK